jgi:23S rRNA (adenine-N6)-dimethyltransferase
VSGGQPRTWDWYRLDRAWAERLVAASGVGPGDLVLDIGAGDGALTAPLVASGARVIAVELHPKRAAGLRRRFADGPVRVVQADAADLRLPRRPFHVVANPPWSLVNPLMRRLTHRGSRMVGAHLVLKRSATRRLASRDQSGATFAMWEGATVPRRAFSPPPAIDGRVLVVAARAPHGRGRPR